MFVHFQTRRTHAAERRKKCLTAMHVRFSRETPSDALLRRGKCLVTVCWRLLIETPEQAAARWANDLVENNDVKQEKLGNSRNFQVDTLYMCVAVVWLLLFLKKRWKTCAERDGTTGEILDTVSRCWEEIQRCDCHGSSDSVLILSSSATFDEPKAFPGLQSKYYFV